MRTVAGALYVPMGHASGAAGLFDQTAALVSEASFLRGIPHLSLVDQQPFTSLEPSAVRITAPLFRHLYLGQIHHHYGHFLISCFSRLWLLRQSEYRAQGCKILFTNPEPIGECFRHEHVRVLFGGLGLSEEDFVQYAEPTIIPHAVVPGPAFVENHCAWREFATFCNEVGRTVGGSSALHDSPVYLTKEHVGHGVSHVVNEGDLTAVLAANGVAVVAPEQLAFADQVALFRDSRCVAGLIGSSFHTSIFAPPGRLMMLNYNHVVWSNQLLLDGCNGNVSDFLHVGPDMAPDGNGGTFLNHFRLLEPRRSAERLLHAMNRVRRLAQRPRPRGAVRSGSAEPRRGAARPLGRVLSQGRPTRQSSHSPWSHRATAAEDAAGAVSGMLTGRYQFHTSEEDAPWWDVDLGAPCRITGVTVYNRQDVGSERANAIRILTSDDGASWQELGRRVSDEPFGGLAGEPWRHLCEGSVRARLIRLELLNRRHFHLDQVEVFGLPLDPLDVILD